MKRLTTLLAFAFAFLYAWAVDPTDSILCRASNYYAYPDKNLPKLTPAPEGYKPFHIEHYGRHGSRWHIGKKAYTRPIKYMLPAERNNKLTERGKELLGQLRTIREQSIGRDGELTPLGARQHKGIAQRMVANFPEVFADTAYVTARSSTVIRCILSMLNELKEMSIANPNLRVTSDASEKDMSYIANDDRTGVCPHKLKKAKKAGEEALKAFKKNHPSDYDFLHVLFTDRQFVNDSINKSGLLHYLFNIAANAQSHDDMPAPWDIFTEREVVNQWKIKNADWFLRYGNSQITGGMAPFGQQALMRNIIESADTAMNLPSHGANLRFGHEVILMPLAVLMELNHYGKEINDLEEVADKWHNYEIFPMGSNIQMIFYRQEGSTNADDVLVKVLLNEHECTLPVSPVEGPYYRWTDLRKYYLDKLANMPGKHDPNHKHEDAEHHHKHHKH